jgi:hypothetical protein
LKMSFRGVNIHGTQDETGIMGEEKEEWISSLRGKKYRHGEVTLVQIKPNLDKSDIRSGLATVNRL